MDVPYLAGGLHSEHERLVSLMNTQLRELKETIERYSSI